MTTSQAAFVRSLLRITIIQLLKSIGYNKSPNYLIDILTDLYIRYFELLLEKTQRLSQLRDDLDGIIIIQDISQAIDELALIRPSNPLDLYDIDPINDNYNHLLEHWCFGDIPDRARDTSKPNLKYIRNKRIEDLKIRLNRIGLGGLINSNTYAFSSKTKEEIELEKLLNDEIIINVPEDYLQYLLSKTDKSTRQKLKSTFLKDELYNEYENFNFDEDDEIHEEQQEQQEPQDNNKEIHSNDIDKIEQNYIIAGPTPDSLKNYLPYSEKEEIKEFDIARYLNNENKAMAYKVTPEVEFHDEFKPSDPDDTGLQLGGW